MTTTATTVYIRVGKIFMVLFVVILGKVSLIDDHSGPTSHQKRHGVQRQRGIWHKADRVLDKHGVVLDTLSALASVNVFPALTFGTLLGAVRRDAADGVLPWETGEWNADKAAHPYLNAHTNIRSRTM